MYILNVDRYKDEYKKLQMCFDDVVIWLLTIITRSLF